MPVQRRPFSSLLLPSRAGRAKAHEKLVPPKRIGASPPPESNTDESLSDVEAASHSQFPSSHATSVDMVTGRHSPAATAPQPGHRDFSLRTASTESPSRELVEGNTQTVSSRRETAGCTSPVQSNVIPSSVRDEDCKDSGGDGTLLGKLASVKGDSTAATNTTATSNSKLQSAATSRPHPKAELPSQPALHFSRTPKHMTPKRDPASRHQQPARKRVKVSIKLGDISASRSGSPRVPEHSPWSQEPATGRCWPLRPTAVARHILAAPHASPHVATTLSLTSLLKPPASAAAGSPWSGAAPSHGVYVAPTRLPPSGAPRASARAASAAPRRASALAQASFQPPADTEEVPEIVRRDREVINTMQVSRRTSSRWSEYARDGAPWAPEEEAWLLRQHRAGCPADWLSAQLSRTKSAVKARLKRQHDRRA